MNWYKKANKQLWEMLSSGEEYANLDMDTLDRMAFGFARGDITKLNPKQLQIKWKNDFRNVVAEQQGSGLSRENWAKQIDLSEPIDVIYEDKVFKIDDGYHRYYAALILGIDLNVSLTIKDKPHKAAIMRAISEGKQIPPDVMNEYNKNELV